MFTGTIYDKVTGSVIMTIEAPDKQGVEIQVDDPSSQEILWGQKINGVTHYFVAGSVVPRPAFTFKVSPGLNLQLGEVLRVSNIPPGCSVFYPGGVIQVDDGYIEWSSTTPGEYAFTFELFPYQEVTLNAIVG